ncbi:hypothetical protein AAMO2058_001591300, partial [Amorphochlora amoebiformis]
MSKNDISIGKRSMSKTDTSIGNAIHVEGRYLRMSPMDRSVLHMDLCRSSVFHMNLCV